MDLSFDWDTLKPWLIGLWVLPRTWLLLRAAWTERTRRLQAGSFATLPTRGALAANCSP